MSHDSTFKNRRLTYRLNIVAQEAIDANDEIFVRETGLRIRDLRVLRLIDDNPDTTFAEISQTTGLERSLTSRIIQGLLKAGLIKRRNSDRDARVFMLRTTKKGQAVRQKGREVSDRLEILLTKPLSREELTALDDSLARLGDWLRSDDYRDALRKS
ncbi:MAG: MarR family transcriptional regulator [Rhodobacteraceae bacterium]|nr:MAG: MarR family transcriptional regulator [Paracoccaceae bacterium]